MKRMIVLAALAVMMVMSAQAQGPAKVPAYRGIIERVQPNGQTVRTYLHGDERMHWMTTEDGWEIRETPALWYKYAKMNRKGQVVTSHRRAHDVEKRTKCEKKWLEKHGIKKN